MISGPALSGADQLTFKLVTDAGDTDGASGAPGASVSSSITVTVIVWSAVITRASLPLVARTTTT